jgi:hypothetical protein
MLKGRFLPGYPDDLQVIVHDGGPQFAQNEPEIVWVTVNRMDGDVFGGRVLNQPRKLQTVRQGDQVKFVVPQGNPPAELMKLAAVHLGLKQPTPSGWLAPLMVTGKYLREREAWIIHPCPQCGLSELFDAPSDLIRVLFPHNSPEAPVSNFTVMCPQCCGMELDAGALRRILRRLSQFLPLNLTKPRRSSAALRVESVRAASNMGSDYLETAGLYVANMTEIGALLATITDDASCDVALPKLDQATSRHDALRKKMESYSLSLEGQMKLAQGRYQEYLAANSDLTVSTAATQANAAFAQSKAPGRKAEIEAAMMKLGLT